MNTRHTPIGAVHLRPVDIDGVSMWAAASVFATGVEIVCDITTAPGDQIGGRLTAGVDAFVLLRQRIEAWTDTDVLTVYVCDSELRRFLKTAGVTKVRFINAPCGRFRELLAYASTQLPGSSPPKPAVDDASTVELRRRLVVATDASKGAHSGCGIAYISELGDHDSMYRSMNSVCEAELSAIEMSVTALAQPQRPLLILTDSQDAVECLTRPEPWRHSSSRIHAIVRRIHEAAAGSSVRYEWVRGHSGHPLNEAADRLAVAARRHHQAKVPAPTRNRMIERIVASVCTETVNSQ